MFLIHLMACACGSTMSGQRDPRVTITPFSVLNRSVGKPWMFHSRTSVGLDKKLENLNSGLHGMVKRRTCGSHTCSMMASRYCERNGPM